MLVEGLARRQTVSIWLFLEALHAAGLAPNIALGFGARSIHAMYSVL